MRTDIKLTAAEIAAIEDVLARDERVMIIPVKTGLKLVRVRNEEIKVDKKAEYITKY